MVLLARILVHKIIVTFKHSSVLSMQRKKRWYPWL